MVAVAVEYAALMEPVARFLLGEPNARMSSTHELRYGSRGSLSIDVQKGTWFDNEANEGGGVLDLVTRETKLEGKARFDWLHENGFDVEGDRVTNGHAKGRAKIVATYDYCDEAGKLLFQVVRFEPKDFRQRKPEGNGWSWSVKGVRQVPYRLPELIEALAQDHTVFIVEGEKDVENLRRYGITATCNAGGAGKWKPELTEFLVGADVVIIPDYDPQKKHPKTGELQFHEDGHPILPGQDHAQAVAEALDDIATRVRVLELWRHWPQMPLKGDVSDWLKTGGSAEALYALVEQTPIWAPGSAASPAIVLALQDWLDRIEPGLDIVLGQFLSTTTRALLNASTGLGKTMLGIALGLRIAAGAPFLHWQGTGKPRRVLFIDGEMTVRGLKRRLVSEVERFKFKPEGFYALCHEDINNFQPLNTPAGQKQIEDVIARIGGVDFIFFDNIMSLIAGDMKEEDGWRQTLPWIKSLTKRSIGQLWLHHTGHDETHGYGTKIREWQMDVVAHCTRIERASTTLAFALKFTKARDRTFDTRGEFADVIITLDDGEIWQHELQASGKVRKSLQPLAQKFLNILCEAIGNSQLKLDGFPAATLNDWRLLCIKRGLIDQSKRDSARSLLSKYRLQLIEAERIVVDGEMIRLVSEAGGYQSAMF